MRNFYSDCLRNFIILQLYMLHASLDKDLIPQSDLWTMAFGISSSAIDVVLFPPVRSEPVIHRTVPLDMTADECRAVEEAVYDNPLLLSEFKDIRCSLPGGCFMILPPEVATDRKLVARMFRLEHPDATGVEPVVLETAASNAVVVAGVSPELYGFLRRSFYRVRFTHPLVPLIDSLCRQSGDSASMLVRITPDSVDVVVVEGRRLLMANTFRITAPIDAAYYVMAGRKSLGLDTSVPLRIAGQVDLRRQVADILRPYLADLSDYSMPPRLWQAGTAALTAPLHLILLHPSCV